MSHFGVLVIGNDVDAQLAPYHEYECTGVEDEYVIEIDETEEYTDEYVNGTTRMMKNLETGEFSHTWEDIFYRDPKPEEEKRVGLGTGWGGGIHWTSKDWGDGKGYRAKVAYVPEGYEEVEVPYKEVMSFIHFVKEYKGVSTLKPGEEKNDDHDYQYAEVDENDVVVKVVRKTNPNAKWDWYQVGGRFSKFLNDRMGNPIVQGPKKAFNFEAARDEAEKDARDKFSQWDAIWKKHGKPIFWDVFIARVDSGEITIDEAREEYHKQPAIKEWNEENPRAFRSGPEDIGYDLDDYVKKCRDNACITHAIVIDGKWYERGEMGWWACVHDEKDDWNDEFNKLIDSVDDDTMITVVDCHI